MSERDDREFDDYLRGGSRLSDAYREARAEEPSADVDEVLLERSRRELRLGPKVAWSPFTRSWSLPLALAAVLVVSVSVTLLMYQETGEPLPVPVQPAVEGPVAPRAPARDQAAPAPATKSAPAPAISPAPPPPAASTPSPVRERVPAPPAPPREEHRIQLEGRQRDLAAPAAESAPAASREAGRAGPALQSAPAAPRAEEKLAPAPHAKQEAARDADLGPDPEVWVRRIEALRREDRHAEADVLLAEFRKRFPDYPQDRLPK